MERFTTTDHGRGVTQRPYVATTEQVWALHDALPAHLRPAILLGAFVGLRLAETCGLRTSDIDFVRGAVHPAVQYPAEPLKTETSRTAVPIPQSLTLKLSVHIKLHPGEGEWLLHNERGDQLSPKTLQRHFAAARVKVEGLAPGFRYHDLRHYLASLLIASGADVKVVQTRRGCGTRVPRPLLIPTAICGPTRTTRPGLPSRRCSQGDVTSQR